MNILIVQESDWLKRGPHQQHQLADRLSLREHQIRVIDYEILWREQPNKELFSKHQVIKDVLKIDPRSKVTVIRPGILKVPILDYVSLVFTHQREISRQCSEFRPDIIVSFGILNNYLALRAANKNNIPFIYYWIDVLHRLIPFKLLQSFGQLLEKRALRQADRVITINDKLKDYVISQGAPENRTKVIRAGIDVKKFKPTTTTTSIRGKYGIHDNDFVLFFMGWLYHFSGLKEVLLELAKEEDQRWKMLIVGEGDALEDLKLLREKYNLENRVIFTGQRPYTEMPALIEASDICILPAYPREKVMQDIVPIKLYEYLAMEKPVIATKLPGVMSEFGENNGVIYINEPDDTIAKAKELAESGKIRELGIKARKFVERYNWDSIADEFEVTLQQAIEEKKKWKTT